MALTNDDFKAMEDLMRYVVREEAVTKEELNARFQPLPEVIRNEVRVAMDETIDAKGIVTKDDVNISPLQINTK